MGRSFESWGKSSTAKRQNIGGEMDLFVCEQDLLPFSLVATQVFGRSEPIYRGIGEVQGDWINTYIGRRDAPCYLRA